MWPVSAACNAVPMVSRSRISPTRMTSGSWRREARNAARERRRIDFHLALVDVSLLVAVQEFDRVFDGDDVFGAGGIDAVDHRGQRRGLAGTGDAGDQHQAARLVADLLHDLRQIEFVERANLGGNDAQHHPTLPRC